jgi:dTDP-3-amino-3,4,6-trideoxy-alpha-D-glucose transaminase
MDEPILPADPGAAYRAHRQEVDAAVRRVLESGWYILGEEAEMFEREFASYVGVAHGVGVGSGTDAIQIALRAVGVGPGHEVITAGFGPVAPVAAIELIGAVPVLVDIDADTFCLRPEGVARAVTEQTRAILAVHLYGHPAEMDALLQISADRGIALVEDAAQSHGARYGGRMTGSFGAAAAFSFYPTKNLGALGDAGMVLTNRSELADRARLIRQYGWQQRQVSDIKGLNSRLDALQAAVLRARLPLLADENTRRREIASTYTKLLRQTGVRLPVEADRAECVHHQYAIRSPRRDALQEHLRKCGIGTGLLYPLAIHQHPAYTDNRLPDGGLPNSESAGREVLCMPVHPHLTDLEIERAAAAVVAFDRV